MHVHAANSDYRLPAAYAARKTPHQSKTISMHVKQLHAHVAALEARVVMLQQHNAALEAKSSAFEQALSAKLVFEEAQAAPQRAALQREACLSGLADSESRSAELPPGVMRVVIAARPAPTAESCSDEPDAAAVFNAQIAAGAKPRNVDPWVPNQMPLTGWRGNLQSELQNKTLQATNARLRREADKMTRELEALQAKLRGAEQNASQGEARRAHIETSHKLEQLRLEQRSAEDKVRTVAGVRKLLHVMEEVQYDPPRLELRLERLLKLAQKLTEPAELVAMVEQMLEVEASENLLPVRTRSESPVHVARGTGTATVVQVSAEEQQTQERLRLFVQVEEAVGRARSHLAKVVARENCLEARKEAQRAAASADRSFGVAPTHRPVQIVQKAISATHFVASSGANATAAIFSVTNKPTAVPSKSYRLPTRQSAASFAILSRPYASLVMLKKA